MPPSRKTIERPIFGLSSGSSGIDSPATRWRSRSKPGSGSRPRPKAASARSIAAEAARFDPAEFLFVTEPVRTHPGRGVDHSDRRQAGAGPTTTPTRRPSRRQPSRRTASAVRSATYTKPPIAGPTIGPTDHCAICISACRCSGVAAHQPVRQHDQRRVLQAEPQAGERRNTATCAGRAGRRVADQVTIDTIAPARNRFRIRTAVQRGRPREDGESRSRRRAPPRPRSRTAAPTPSICSGTNPSVADVAAAPE